MKPGERISKTDANYRVPVTMPKRRCGICSMFREPSSCSLVVGRISEFGTCAFWEAKKGGE